MKGGSRSSRRQRALAECMERIMNIPAITYDSSLILKEMDRKKLDALLEEEKRQDEAQWNAWEEIVTDKRSIAFSYTQRCEYPLTLILHPSPRPEADLQLTRIAWDGIPNGHDVYLKDNLLPLLNDLTYYSKSGGDVRVICKD